MNPQPALGDDPGRMVIKIEDTAYSARELLRLGCEVRVISPPELADAVVEEARRVVGVYVRD